MADDNDAVSREFSPQGYRALIRALRARGYDFVALDGAVPSQRHVVLRHDIDLCLQAAAELAEIESAEGARSIYYVLLSTELYNPAGTQSQAAIARILNAGHEIGLHFDAAPHALDAAEAAAARECKVLESITGRPVRSISFHRPQKEWIGHAGMIAGRMHAYEPRFFSDLVYVADSEGRWRFGHPLDHEGVAQGRAVQLVTHPIWWVTPGADVIAKLERFRAERAALTRREMAINLKPYAAVFGADGAKAGPA
jgi:hypothetical protein